MRAARILAGVAALVAATMIPAGAYAAGLVSTPACTTPPVSAPAGRFCGISVTVNTSSRPTDVYVYKGIRFGQAQRWMAPAPIPPPANLVEATAFGPVCPQELPKGVDVAQSEDCLLLNIWTPTRNSAANLPVMVLIPGGGFLIGAGRLPVYHGARLAAWGKAVIVTFSYRLGALGFLAGGSGENALAGNYGFLDQQLALGWVRRNIRSFGGDAGAVTIFGESAGAISVGAHLAAPGSRKLFRNAIMESNTYGIPFETAQQADTVREAFDLTRDAETCNGKLGCLRKLPVPTILGAQVQTIEALASGVLYGSFAYALVWSPHLDPLDANRPLIPKQPNEAVIAQPVIAGTNRDEGTLYVGRAFKFLHLTNGLRDDEYEKIVHDALRPHDPQILAQSRYKPDGRGNFRPLSNLVGDYFFSCATRHVLAHATGPHFGYAFDHPPSFSVWPGDVQKCNPPSHQVCHAVELPFVFRNPINVNLPTQKGRFTPEERKLVDAVSTYWTDFARSGDPNSGAATPPEWPAYGAAGTRQVLDLTISKSKDSELDCPLWDSIGYNHAAALLQ